MKKNEIQKKLFEEFIEGRFPICLATRLAFSSVFAGVFWFRSRHNMPGLAEMNELILRDESFHYEFALQMFKDYIKDEYKPSKEQIRQVGRAPKMIIFS